MHGTVNIELIFTTFSEKIINDIVYLELDLKVINYSLDYEQELLLCYALLYAVRNQEQL